MNAAKYGLDRVFFGGCFIRGEFANQSRLHPSVIIRFPLATVSPHPRPERSTLMRCS
jgi:hypothetical protein